ncbi:MAG: hypothetical protein H0U18_07445 [Pyrinomonadaceae bacterium]|nr:hypothetical protein [Pyrinomonadaceae bacterium]
MIDALPKSSEIYLAQLLGGERPEFKPPGFGFLLALGIGRMIGIFFDWS